MLQTYQFTFIDAPIETVWRMVLGEAEQNGSVVMMRKPHLVVSHSKDVFSVYGLRQHPSMEGKTGVYLVVTQDKAAVKALRNSPALFSAIKSLPVDVDPEIYETAKTHLHEIKGLMNEAAQASTSEKLKHDAPKPSHDPAKSGKAALIPFGQGMPVIRLRLMWAVLLFSLVAIRPLWGLFLAVSLVALNWWAMGKLRQAAITILISTLIWTLPILILERVLWPGQVRTYGTVSIFSIIQILVAAGVVFWQIRLQKPAYHQAVERYGKPSGWGGFNVMLAITALLVGGFLGNAWLRTLDMMPPMPFVLWNQTYTDNTLTFAYPFSMRKMPAEYDICQFVTRKDLECWSMESSDLRNTVILVQGPVGFGPLATLETWSQSQINENEDYQGDPDATQRTLTVDGREAIQYEYNYDVKSSRQDYQRKVTLLYIRENNNVIQLSITASSQQPDFADGILKSLHFLTPVSED